MQKSWSQTWSMAGKKLKTLQMNRKSLKEAKSYTCQLMDDKKGRDWN